MIERSASSASFIFFTELTQKPVVDREGRVLGRIADLALTSQDAYPKATHLILSQGGFAAKYAAVSWDKIDKILLGVHLKIGAEAVEFREEKPAFDFALQRDILDQQVVDTSGQKVIRVNDVHLLMIEGEICLAHVDVGLSGIVRRLGWQWWVDSLVRIVLGRAESFKDQLINWRFIQPLAINPQKGTLKLTIPQRQLSTIPHADFSEMMLSMDVYQRLALFKTLDPELRPKLFSELDLEIQRGLIENMEPKPAAELLSKIPAGQTTDILEDLPKDMADRLLALMESGQARRLSALLGYTSDSAGGLMTTEMITCPQGALVSHVLDQVRSMTDHLDNIHQIFIVDESGRLLAQVPLKRLVLAQPGDPVSLYALPKPVYVRASDSLREVTYLMEKYRLSAVPVVSNGRDRTLQGVITADGILERIVPLAWRRRVKKSSPA